MRPNKFGIRGMKGVWLKGRFVYFWMPPVSLQKAGVFRHTTLGTDFEIAVAIAREWNAKLDAHRGINNFAKAHPWVGYSNDRCRPLQKI
jgi:hypothetical protein